MPKKFEQPGLSLYQDKKYYNKNLPDSPEQISAREVEAASKFWTSLESDTTCKPHAELHEIYFFGSIDARTDIGGQNSKYDHNEDSLCITESKDQIIVGIFDGAGGSEKGELASALGNMRTIREAKKFHETKKIDLNELLRGVDQRIRKGARGGYATSVILGLTKIPNSPPLINLAAAGDAKIITIRKNNKLPEGTTTFQNEAQHDIDQNVIPPEEYYTHHHLNIITGGLGLPKQGVSQEAFETKTFVAQPGDRIILADDGLWDNISEFEILELHQKYPDRQFEQRLFELAYSRNNTVGPFIIRHNETTHVEKTHSYFNPRLVDTTKGLDGFLRGGDNITLAVLHIE